MSIFPAGYLNSHKDDADDAIDTGYPSETESALVIIEQHVKCQKMRVFKTVNFEIKMKF